jgi:hypothetical protein
MTCLRVRTAVLLAVLAAAVSLAAADLPWVGQWKINVAKSNYGEWTVTYADAGPGEMQATMDGMTMKFKMTADYPDPWGGLRVAQVTLPAGRRSTSSRARSSALTPDGSPPTARP